MVHKWPYYNDQWSRILIQSCSCIECTVTSSLINKLTFNDYTELLRLIRICLGKKNNNTRSVSLSCFHHTPQSVKILNHNQHGSHAAWENSITMNRGGETQVLFRKCALFAFFVALKLELI